MKFKRKNSQKYKSNSQITNILDKISKTKNLPPDIQSIINNSCYNVLDSKLKKEICELYPRLKKFQKQYAFTEETQWCDATRLITKLYFKLPFKYKKRFIVFLEEDLYTINKPNILAFRFLLKHLQDIVKYIGNREQLIHNDVFEFLVCFYGEHAIKPPTKVNFRYIMCSVTEYFYIKEINTLEQDLII
tara:strand:- start:5742 stop:6308 length:567 start_codon:yes stop_codon:yes gene_type:complete